MKTLDLINDLVEYMEERSDADYNYEAGRYKPNKEMQLLVRLKEWMLREQEVRTTK